MNTKNLMVVLFFSVVVRAWVTILFGYWNPHSAYQTSFFFLNQLFFYFLLFGASIVTCNLSKTKILELIGKQTNKKTLAFAVVGAVLLVMFSLGEHAIEVMLVASFDTNIAYRMWNFHEHVWTAPSFLSFSVGSYVVTSVLLGPSVEEFFFRGLLLRAYSKKNRFFFASVISSIIFMAMHYSRQYYLMTFCFSMILCYTYALTGSLVICTVFHGAFNFIAYIQEYYFDIQWTRSLNQLNSPLDWIPQLVMLGISAVALIYIVRRTKIMLRAALLSHLSNN